VNEDCLQRIHATSLDIARVARRKELLNTSQVEEPAEIDKSNWKSKQLQILSGATSSMQLFEQYVEMHRAASREPVSSKRSYWVWHAGREGFGNRMRSLLSLLLMSVALNKVFYIVWDEPVHHSQLLKFRVDFDAAPHLDRLHAHFGKANASICIPCTTHGDECTNPELEKVRAVDSTTWTTEYVHVPPAHPT
jgi:hypothetical protein